MKHVVPLAFLVGAVSGAVGGGLTTVLVGSTHPDAAPSAALVAPADEGLADRVAHLTDEVDALSDRVAFVEQRPLAPAESTRQPVADDSPETADVGAELRDLATALRSPDSGYVPPNFQETVGRALENIREQEDREREEQRAAARAEAMERRLQQMTDQLSLAPYQVDGMRKIWNDRDARMSEARDAMQNGNDWGAARETFRTIRDETEKAVTGLLSGDQLEKYKQMDDRGFGGFGGPGGGRGGRGGRGGGGGGGGN